MTEQEFYTFLFFVVLFLTAYAVLLFSYLKKIFLGRPLND